MARFKDQAICIRLIDWSETSQIVLLLCQNHGKLSGVAKGSKRTSPSSIARYSGGIELLTMGQVVGVIKPTVELATLTEWDLQAPHWHLRQNLRAQRLGLYGADLAAAMLADHDPHPRSFVALGNLLSDLAVADKREQALLLYQWRLLADCGYRPQLDYDVRSGVPLASGRLDSTSSQRPSCYLFDPRAGGLTAESNGTADGCWRVRASTVELLQQLAAIDPERFENVVEQNRPSMAKTVDRANQLLCAYARAILDRQLPTMGYIFNGTSQQAP